MDENNTRWCSAPGCMINIKITKRHFFRFPKERERWLEWIKACNRMDLITVGPMYANQFYRLCHLHFRVEMFRNIEGRIYLSKEAVPSIFLKPIQTGNNTSTDLFPPISFVTIYLKPESRNRNSSALTQPIISEAHSMKPSEEDTAIISPLQALFPRASIKQAQENRNMPLMQTKLLEMRPEINNGNFPVEIKYVKNICTDSIVSTPLSRISPIMKCNDEMDIIDLTSMDSSMPTTSKIVPVYATQQNGDRTLKRRRWNVSTQTPDARVYIDSLGKRRMEKTETRVDELIAKRRKTFCAGSENQHVNVDQFKAACAELLPRSSALLVSACVNAGEKRKTQRNFKGRQFALELFLTAPSAYRVYRPLCLLPTVRQLWRHIRNWDMPPGLNDNVLNALRSKMKSLSPVERRCCLSVNRMRLRPHLFYNLSRDRIIGFFDIGTQKQRTLAENVLVIMARSLAGDWEQPIAYYFYGDACDTDVVKDLIFQVIIRMKSIGANVHALVTNTTPIFLQLSRLLDISAEHPSFLVDDERVFYFFDVTCLMRITRNIFMNYELHFREKRASWQDIKLFFGRDSQMRLPLVPKLSMAHIEPNRHQKVDTKYAIQIFSSSVAAGLSAGIASGEFPLKTTGTLELVYNFDQLFDILNSSAPTKTNKDFGQAFTGNVHEMCFLHRMFDLLKSIKVINGNGAYVNSIKCFDHWQITINAIIQLWNALKEHQFSFLRTRRLNQEGIERVFRSIRRQSGNRIRPTPILFTRAFKNLVSKHFLEHSNEDNPAANTRRMLKRIASTSLPPNDEVRSAVAEITLSVAVTNYHDFDLQPEKSAFKRVCEFLLNECLCVHVNCDVCVAYAESSSSNKEAKNSFSLYVSGLEEMFMRNFEKLSVGENLGAQMLQFAQQVKYKPACPDFPVAFLVKLFLRMRIYFTLSWHNKICKGIESQNSLNVLRL